MPQKRPRDARYRGMYKIYKVLLTFYHIHTQTHNTPGIYVEHVYIWCLLLPRLFFFSSPGCFSFIAMFALCSFPSCLFPASFLCDVCWGNDSSGMPTGASISWSDCRKSVSTCRGGESILFGRRRRWRVHHESQIQISRRSPIREIKDEALNGVRGRRRRRKNADSSVCGFFFGSRNTWSCRVLSGVQSNAGRQICFIKNQ